MFYPAPIPTELENKPLSRNKKGITLTESDKLDIDEGIAQLSKRVRENHQLIDEYIDLGKLFRKKGEYQRGFVLLRNLLVRDDLKRDQQFRVYAELGYIYLFSKTKDYGEAYFLQALKLNKNSSYVLHGMYEAYREVGDIEKAIGTLRDLVKIQPDRQPELLMLLTESCFEKASQGHLAIAKKWLDQAEDLKIESPFLHLARAHVQTLDKKSKEAIKTLEEFVDKWPLSSPMAFKKIETLYYESNQYNRYAYTLTKCIQKNPQNFYAHHELGKYFMKIKKTDEAIDHFEKAIQLYPLSMQSMKELIEFYKIKNDQDSIARILDTLITAMPTNQTMACPKCNSFHPTPGCSVCSSLHSSTALNY